MTDEPMHCESADSLCIQDANASCLWICPKGHGMKITTTVTTEKGTIERGESPLCNDTELRGILFGEFCFQCPTRPDGVAAHYNGCDLILNRNWTVDELIMGELEVHDRSCDICLVTQNREEETTKSSWQPKYLGNTKVKP